MNKKLINKISTELWNFIPQYHKFMHNFEKNKSNQLLNKSKKKALMIIHYHGEMYMSKLGECIDLQKGSLTTLIDSLENNGYIKRKFLTSDRRKTVLTLTNKANNIINNRQNDMEEYISILFKKLSDTEITQLLNSIKMLTKIMAKI